MILSDIIDYLFYPSSIEVYQSDKEAGIKAVINYSLLKSINVDLGTCKDMARELRYIGYKRNTDLININLTEQKFCLLKYYLDNIVEDDVI